MNEIERQKYYQYDYRNNATWFHHPRPYLDEYFNKELLKLAGKDVFGDQIIRIAWAGEIPDICFHEDTNGKTHEYHGRKYAAMKRKVLNGYIFKDKQGHDTRVPRLELVPDWAIPVEDFYYDDLGVMKWVVEMKYSAEQLVDIGRYPKLESDEARTWCVKNGQRYRIKPDRAGEYVLCFFIETPDSMGQSNFGYRDIRESDLEAIRMIIHTAQTESDDEYVGRKIADIERVLELEKTEKERRIDNALGDAIIRAEKLPQGVQFFDLKKK